MKTEWVTRAYEPGDEVAILELFTLAFGGRQMSREYWEWMFAKGPFGPGVITLLFDGERIIGHYAITPMGLEVAGAPVRALLSMTTMTHPDYGRQGIFLHLLQETCKRSAELGFALVYGFPNNNSNPGFLKRGWKDFGKVVEYARASPNTPARRIPNIAPISRFGVDVDRLWEQVAPHMGITVARTAAYLNWRFFDHPTAHYRVQGLFSGSRLRGYVVTKVYAPEGKPAKGHIIDLVAIAAADALVLVQAGLEDLTAHSVEEVSAWFPPDSFVGIACRQEGFLPQVTDTNWGMLFLKGRDSLHKQLEDQSGWHLTMANSDVY